MSKQTQLNAYIQRLRKRLRLRASLRGAAILTACALLATVALVAILNVYAFPDHGLNKARLALLAILILATGLGLVLPLARLSQRRSVERAEAEIPAFRQRLLTFHERGTSGEDPFLELLAGDTLAIAQDTSPSILAPNLTLGFLAGGALAGLALLVWMIAAGPGYMGYGASLLWTGPKQDALPLYDIRVAPGDVAVRRHSDQLITADVVGVKTEAVRLFAQYQGTLAKAGTQPAWESVAMRHPPGASGFQFLFTGLPQDVEYYVQAGPLTSAHFKVRVVDLPAVKQIQVTYRYPRWTGLQPVSEDHGGDLRALEGTDAEIRVSTDRPLKEGVLMLGGGQQLHLSGGEGNVYRGSIHMDKDGAYHVAAIDGGQQVRLSEDYFISTEKASPPEIAIDRPGADYRASPIEEVSVSVKATAEFGLSAVSLHYSVNGGADHNVNLLKQTSAKKSSGTEVLPLEEFNLVPGDVVSLYATARDGHAESRTDITFIQAEPFEREFSQSQQGGGGAGGGGKQNQTDISKREKELIEATWKQQNDRAATPKGAADSGRFLSDVQTKLRDQVLALAGRMESRDLSSANEEFTAFGKDMQAAAAAMGPSSEKLKNEKWPDAIAAEQKALQFLLRAEATFRQIQVAFGQQRGAGGGGGGNAGRDLASLFDLELDTQKNQYESAQTASAPDQRAKEVDDALQKLDALARRQEELAQQEQKASPTFQERWQQEMLRREAEQLQRQMEQLARGREPEPNSQSGGSGSRTSNQSQPASGRPGASQAPTGAQPGGADPRIEQALSRLRQASDAMARGGQPQSPESARRAAEQLREAKSLLSGTQQEQASGRLDSLAREAQRLSKEEQAQADRIRNAAGQRSPANGQQTSLRSQSSGGSPDRVKLADDRQRLSDDLSGLEKGLRDTARQLAPSQPGASSKLRDALAGMDQADLGNRVQRTADWLRRGIDPTSNGTEEGIGRGLQSLSEQVRQAQQGMGSPRSSQRSDPGRQTAALDHVDRLRSQIESLTGKHAPVRQGGRTAQGNQPERPRDNNQAGGLGRSLQEGQLGQQGQGDQQGRGSAPGMGDSRQGGGRQPFFGQGQRGGQQAGENPGQLARGGDVGNRGSAGGQGAAWNNVNTGNNHFDATGQRRIIPADSSSPAADRAYQDSMGELNQLRELARSDPATLKEVQELIREMQRLDPSRFPGNPAMVEQLHTEVLSQVDRLELQLRRDRNDQAPGQTRTVKPSSVPPQYRDAVAEYFRRLSEAH